MIAQKLISQPVPLDAIYTNELIPAINDFDRDAIKRQAAAFDIGNIK